MTERCLLTQDYHEIFTGKPRVSVKPQSSVFSGDTVTLSCDVRRSTGRRIIWYKDSKIIKTGDETSYTLRDVRVSDGGEYWCGVENLTQGHRVTLTVRGESCFTGQTDLIIEILYKLMSSINTILYCQLNIK